MLEHQILINRPFVVAPPGVRLCRPSEVVPDILPARQKGSFTKEAREQVNGTARYVTAVFKAAMSRRGGAPNMRAYSRLNCDGLS